MRWSSGPVKHHASDAGAFAPIPQSLAQPLAVRLGAPPSGLLRVPSSSQPKGPQGPATYLRTGRIMHEEIVRATALTRGGKPAISMPRDAADSVGSSARHRVEDSSSLPAPYRVGVAFCLFPPVPRLIFQGC